MSSSDSKPRFAIQQQLCALAKPSLPQDAERAAEGRRLRAERLEQRLKAAVAKLFSKKSVEAEVARFKENVQQGQSLENLVLVLEELVRAKPMIDAMLEELLRAKPMIDAMLKEFLRSKPIIEAMLEELVRAKPMLDTMVQARQSLDDFSKLSAVAADNMFRDLEEFRRLGQPLDGFSKLSAAEGIGGYIQSIERAAGVLGATCGTDLLKVIDWDFREALAPALAANRYGLLAPDFGLLAGNSVEALLSWAPPGRNIARTPALWCAPLLQLGPAFQRLQGKRVEVRCTVRCDLCASPIIVTGEKRLFEDDDRLNVELEIVPLCPTCLRLASEDPNYWEDNVSHLAPPPPPDRRESTPRFKLIRGSSDGTTQSRGHDLLHLVPPPDDEAEKP